MEGMLSLQPSFNEFMLFFNEKVLQMRPNFVIHDYEWFPKAKQTFFLVRFGKEAALYGAISQSTGAISDLSFIHEKRGGSDDRLDFMVGGLLMIDSLGLKLTSREKSGLFESLGIVKGKRKHGGGVTLGNVSFRYYETEGPGFYALFIRYHA